MFSIEDYTSKMDEIEGWCSPLSAKIIYDLSKHQSILGNVMEIGVHHGKSFIPLFATIKDIEIGVALDIFDQQHLNKDHSGKGSQESLLLNLSNSNLSVEKLKIIKEDSTIIKSKTLLDYGKFRSISIDGGHTEEATISDLILSNQILHEKDGIIFLDDILNPHWLGVISGYFNFNLNNKHNLVPICLIPNKLVLCRINSVKEYKNFLRERFASNLSKTNVPLFNYKIDIYM